MSDEESREAMRLGTKNEAEIAGLKDSAKRTLDDIAKLDGRMSEHMRDQRDATRRLHERLDHLEDDLSAKIDTLKDDLAKRWWKVATTIIGALAAALWAFWSKLSGLGS